MQALIFKKKSSTIAQKRRSVLCAHVHYLMLIYKTSKINAIVVSKKLNGGLKNFRRDLRGMESKKKLTHSKSYQS